MTARAAGAADCSRPHGGVPPARRRAPWRGTVLVGGGVFAVYLTVAVAIWWQVWSGHPSTAMTCGCGDPSLVVWAFRWTALSVQHGHNPFLSTAMFHPDGINLLANTGTPLFGFLLVPVTWLAGPVFSLNVANTLAPALSAAATYWAVRRCLGVTRGAALVAGLVVEFSPPMILGLAVSHLQFTMLAFVPVVAVCLYELLVRQQGRPWRWGAVLAVTTLGQFLVGTEMLVIVALFVVPLVLLVGLMLGLEAVRGSPGARDRLGHAAAGLGVGAVGAVILLAAPAWYALLGPRHVSGIPHAGLQELAGSPPSDVLSRHSTAADATLLHFVGYLGPLGAPTGYLGLGAIVAAALALVVCWRRSAVWILWTVAVVALWLSIGAVWQPFGTVRPAWVPFLPWATVGRLPVIKGVLPQSFLFLVVLAVAGLVALLLDQIWRWGRGRTHGAAAATALGISAAVLGPLVTAWPLPLTAAPITVPRWFSQVGPTLTPQAVVLAYPFPGPPGRSRAVIWQAVTGIRFDLAGGCCIVPGPTGAADHGQTAGSANAILASLTLTSGGGPPPALDDTQAMAVVRTAIRAWGVTTVVITRLGRDPAYAIQWFTALLGRPPMLQAGAHVWTLP